MDSHVLEGTLTSLLKCRKTPSCLKSILEARTHLQGHCEVAADNSVLSCQFSLKVYQQNISINYH